MSNILETTLAMLGIEQYIKEFRRYGIDVTVLPLLSNNDLKLLGIEDNELREKILRQFSTLPTPNDNDIELNVDNDYMLKVLNDMNNHLLLLNASLSFAYHTDKIKITDIKLSKPAQCLLNCIESFEHRTNLFHETFPPITVKKNNTSKYLAIIVVLTTTAVFTIRRYLK